MRRVDKAIAAAAAVIVAALLVTACGGQKERQREEAFERWEALVRWSEYDMLSDLMHPEWLAENPIRNIDLSRLRQFRVTQYRVRRVNAGADGDTVERLARVRMYHVQSARERVITHREVWRYDEDTGRWMLHSGLPDPGSR